MKTISDEMLKSFRTAYDGDTVAHTLNAAMAKTELCDLAFVPMNAAKLNGPFAVEVKTRGITAQLRSGRCWMFAALNIMREIVAEKLNLKEFELSQNYITFYDKLEKANTLLEFAIENADRPVTSQVMRYILKGVGDGGYWGQAVDLIQKYGAVPKSVNPESFQSEHTDRFMDILNNLLKKDICELRKLVAAGVDPRPRKEEMLQEIYKAECIVFGQPVDSFDFEYKDADGVYHCDRGLTPHSFYEKYIGMELEDYVAVISEPKFNKPMNSLIQFHSRYNMADKDLCAINIPQEELEALVVAQLKDGEPLWFACDSSSFGHRKEGVWDPDSLDYEGLLGGIDFFMPKGERFDYGATYPDHAMMLMGVNFGADGRPDRWKIENSWGKDAGRDGYFVCSEKYFQEYVYSVIINKKHLSDAQKAILQSPAVIIDPWDED